MNDDVFDDYEASAAGEKTVPMLHDYTNSSSSLSTSNAQVIKDLSDIQMSAGIDDEDRKSRLSFGSNYSIDNHPQNSAPMTIFLMINTMIGSGILNQPFVFKTSGVFGGLIMFFLATIATWWGLVCLTAAGVEINALEYGGLSKKSFGKAGEKMIDVAIVFGSFGSLLGYILIVGDTLSSLLLSWTCDSVACGYVLTTILAVGIFVTPICMFRHFGHLAFLSIFSVTAIAAVLLLVIIGGPIKYQPHSGTVLYISPLGMLRSTGSIVFCLSCASANFQAYITTKKASRTHWVGITFTAVIVGSIMCMTMGVVGYLSFRDNTEGEILDNFTAHGFDFFKVMIVCHLILYIPVNFVIMRYSLTKLILNRRSETLAFSTHTAMTVGLLFFTTGFVIMMRQVGLASGAAFSLILNLTGGIGGCFSSFMFPAAIYIKVFSERGKSRNALWKEYLLFSFGFIVMICVVVIEIMSLILQ